MHSAHVLFRFLLLVFTSVFRPRHSGYPLISPLLRPVPTFIPIPIPDTPIPTSSIPAAPTLPYPACEAVAFYEFLNSWKSAWSLFLSYSFDFFTLIECRYVITYLEIMLFVVILLILKIFFLNAGRSHPEFHDFHPALCSEMIFNLHVKRKMFWDQCNHTSRLMQLILEFLQLWVEYFPLLLLWSLWKWYSIDIFPYL